MHTVTATQGLSKAEAYRELNRQLEGVLTGEKDALANTANTAALIFQLLPGLNWSGFYFLRGSELVLGPFQGKVACVRIEVGRGVCGTAARARQTVIVPDVHAFPGHIACDPQSRSEIVIPLIQAGELIGVLDLDSPLPGRFDAEDASGLAEAVAILLRHSDFSVLKW